MNCIRINQIKLPITTEEVALEKKIAKELRIKTEQIVRFEIVKKSIDARDKGDIKYVYSVDVFLNDIGIVNKKLLQKNISVIQHNKYNFKPEGTEKLPNRPVIAGFGPAGLFCGYYLAKNGYRPIVIERGESVEDRQKTVDIFWETGKLNTESNVQFGEGGAGTFSDGKLNTLVKDKTGRNGQVLETLVRFGANKEIRYVNKPHIGTDALKGIVKRMREEIIKLGGEVRFQTKLTDIYMKNGEVTGIQVNGNEDVQTKVLVLAVGHSARDTFQLLYEKKVEMTSKAFAVGLRMEHPQSMINKSMYGVEQHELLEAADYKVTYNTDTHGIYSFCMCPGGYVVNASSEEGRLAVNGMSYSDRGGDNSNSAIVVTVTPQDYGVETPLSGMEFQRKLEEAAYREGNGKIPVQCFGDFCKNKLTTKLGEVTPCMKGQYEFGNLRNVLPDFLATQMIEGIHGFSRFIRNFDREDAILSGIESRTSSPIRMERGEDLNSISVKGLYPCGEGAGYAGGITSAAMDGIRIFEGIASKYAPFVK